MIKCNNHEFNNEETGWYGTQPPRKNNTRLDRERRTDSPRVKSVLYVDSDTVYALKDTEAVAMCIIRRTDFNNAEITMITTENRKF